MGAWGSGPFENDGAADFLDRAERGAARSVRATLQRIAVAAAERYIDIDDGSAGWAACELVALAFGCGDDSAGGRALAIADRLRPDEQHRQLALTVVRRLAEPATSELAELWQEVQEVPALAGRLQALAERLERAGARGGLPAKTPPARATAGDVLALAVPPPASGMVVIQVLSTSEVAVFEGTCQDDTEALAAVASRGARRMPAPVSEVFRQARVLGHAPLRPDLKGRKPYVMEMGYLDYYLSSASGSGGQSVPYEQARDLDVHTYGSVANLLATALGTLAPERIRSPAQREAGHRALQSERWSQRRALTTPGPFGDLALLERLVDWISTYGMDNLLRRMKDTAEGRRGYGRPCEDPERESYAFCGLVALWRGTWPPSAWPLQLTGKLPDPPAGRALKTALEAARLLIRQVITPDADLRLIWEAGADGGEELRHHVAALQAALD